jgi:hypothetical protein
LRRATRAATPRRPARSSKRWLALEKIRWFGSRWLHTRRALRACRFPARWIAVSRVRHERRLLLPLAVDPGRIAGENRPHETADRLRLFRRTILIAVMRDREEVEARPIYRSHGLDDLLFEPIPGAELPVIEGDASCQPPSGRCSRPCRSLSHWWPSPAHRDRSVRSAGPARRAPRLQAP